MMRTDCELPKYDDSEPSGYKQDSPSGLSLTLSTIHHVSDGRRPPWASCDNDEFDDDDHDNESFV